MDLQVKDAANWEYCSPAAYLHYISTLNPTFGDLMRASLRPGQPATVVLYVDEICPGNPFRPDKARKLQAVYWCMLEWPQWLLSRSAMWPVFGLLRSKIVDTIPGRLSSFMSKVLEICFVDVGQRYSLVLGVQLVCSERQVWTFRCQYGGTIADEKALKEFHDYKGAAGIKPCMDCGNLVHSVDPTLLPPGTIALNTSTLAGVDFNTN